jgi:peptidoglycan LD-endopeptidase LytH
MRRAAAACAALLLAVACSVEDVPVPTIVAPANAREAYVQRLEQAGLANSALVRDWLDHASHALTGAPPVASPFLATGAIDAAGLAHAYRVGARRGQRIRVDVAVAGDSATHVFIDAFQAGEERLQPVRLQRERDGSSQVLIEPDQDGEIIVRVQPDLLRTGRITIALVVEPTLAFPVFGRGSPDVGSVFGDPRDGGGRSHHGIDIFAPRGTPVVAATAGTVSRVNETPRGGLVVWLSDNERGQSLYYAHLDRQLVERGQRVQPGDTLGLVGNSGNARTTPPHLHFGIYRRGRGPVDPFPFVRPTPTQLPEVGPDTFMVGRWTRATAPEAVLRAAPGADANVVTRLPRGTAMRVVAVAGAWLRVHLPDGSRGFVAARSTEDAVRPLRGTIVANGGHVRAVPADDAAVIDVLDVGSRVDVHGTFGDYLLVRSADGPQGWMSASDN